jgi:hypothetical protein
MSELITFSDRNERYVSNNGRVCPNPQCKAIFFPEDDAVIGRGLEYENDTLDIVTRYRECPACHASWNDIFPLSFVREVRDANGKLIEPEEEPDWIQEQEEDETEE